MLLSAAQLLSCSLQVQRVQCMLCGLASRARQAHLCGCLESSTPAQCTHRSACNQGCAHLCSQQQLTKAPRAEEKSCSLISFWTQAAVSDFRSCFLKYSESESSKSEEAGESAACI